MNKFLEAIHDMIEIITGERPETKRNGDRRSKDRGTSDRRLNGTKLAIKKEYNLMMKRARNADGKFKADDKSTKDFNEAWVGGKAPKKKTKRKK